MLASTKKSISNYLNTKYQSDSNYIIKNSYQLQRVVGILGMLLPLLLLLTVYIVNSYGEPLDSISHYYYTSASPIFAGILCVFAVFLIVYRGYIRLDYILSTVAGVAALVVAVLPTNNPPDIFYHSNPPIAIAQLGASAFRVTLHYGAAGVFLGCLAFMSMCLFTKSSCNKTKEKYTRNYIYWTCGIIMIVAIMLIILGKQGILIPQDFYIKHKLTFVFEMIAIESFGFSWLIKGETFFRDKEVKTSQDCVDK